MDAATPNRKTHETSPCPQGPEDRGQSQIPVGQAEAPLGVEGSSEERKVFRCPLALVSFFVFVDNNIDELLNNSKYIINLL